MAIFGNDAAAYSWYNEQGTSPTTNKGMPFEVNALGNERTTSSALDVLNAEIKGASEIASNEVVPDTSDLDKANSFYFDLGEVYNTLNTITRANNAKSASEARIQREWQEQQNAKAMDFNRVEAEKNRNWQEMMSNTAHQREIADLKAAGLNPVLSAMNGNGAAVTSGATAAGVTSAGAKGEVDTSLSSGLVNLLTGYLNRKTDLELAHINAKYTAAIATEQRNLERDLQRVANDYDWRKLQKEIGAKYGVGILQSLFSLF